MIVLDYYIFMVLMDGWFIFYYCGIIILFFLEIFCFYNFVYIGYYWLVVVVIKWEEEGLYFVENKESIDYIKWFMNEYKSCMYFFSWVREYGEDVDVDRINSYCWRLWII